MLNSKSAAPNLALTTFVVTIIASSLGFILPLTFFPSQDFPSLIAGTKTLQILDLPQPNNYQSIFESQWMPTNQGSFLFQKIFLFFDVSAVALGKLEAIFVACLFPLTTLLIAQRLKPSVNWIIFLLLPFCLTSSGITGNDNYILSTCLGIALLLHVNIAPSPISLKSAIKLTVLFTTSVLVHPTGAVLGCTMFFGALIALRLSQNSQKQSFATKLIRLPRQIATEILCFIPGVVLMLAYLFFNHGAGAEHGPGISYGASILDRIKFLVEFRQLYFVTGIQKAFLIGYIASIILISLLVFKHIQNNTRSSKNTLIYGAIIGFLIPYCLLPDAGAGAGGIIWRLNTTFSLLWLILIIVNLNLDSVHAKVLAAVAILCGAGILIVGGLALQKPQKEMLNYYNIIDETVKSGDIVLNISLSKALYKRFPNQCALHNNPLGHFHHIAISDNDAISLTHWTATYPGFPLKYKDDVKFFNYFNPYKIDSRNPVHWEKKSRQKIDSVIIHAPNEKLDKLLSNMQGLSIFLMNNFCLISHSNNTWAYRRKPLAFESEYLCEKPNVKN